MWRQEWNRYLAFTGVTTNTYSHFLRVLEGTLFLNKADGVLAHNTTNIISVGSDNPGSPTALRLSSTLGANRRRTLPYVLAVPVRCSSTAPTKSFRRFKCSPAAAARLRSRSPMARPCSQATSRSIRWARLSLAAGHDQRRHARLASPNNIVSTGANRIFSVGDAYTGDDLEITSTIVDGAAQPSGTVTKHGLGTLVLSGLRATPSRPARRLDRRRRYARAQQDRRRWPGGLDLQIGDGNVTTTGNIGSDRLELRQSEQLPDYNLTTVITSTGMLNFASSTVAETMGFNDFQTLIAVAGGPRSSAVAR